MSETWHGEEAPEALEEPPRHGRLRVVLVAVVAVAIAGVGAWLWLGRQTPAPAPAPVAPPPPVVAAVPPPAPAVNITEGEALLRQLGPQLSAAKELAGWLAQADIVRRLVAAVNLVNDGKTPSAVLGFMRPHKGFEVLRRHKKVYASPKGAARYDLVTRVVTSIDPEAAGKAYAQLRPFADAAFAEVGPKGKTFDEVLRGAISRITSAPPPPVNAELLPKGLGYVYKDAKLEENTPARKQLWRMGPANVAAIQVWLKKVDTALPPPPQSQPASPSTGAVQTPPDNTGPIPAKVPPP
jgi:hypothetical protein